MSDENDLTIDALLRAKALLDSPDSSFDAMVTSIANESKIERACLDTEKYEISNNPMGGQPFLGFKIFSLEEMPDNEALCFANEADARHFVKEVQIARLHGDPKEVVKKYFDDCKPTLMPGKDLEFKPLEPSEPDTSHIHDRIRLIYGIKPVY